MKSRIKESLADALHTIGAGGVESVVEHPSSAEHGDYTANAAMIAAQKLKKSPHECAEILRSAMLKRIGNEVNIEIANPGFLNFRLNRDFFTDTIRQVISDDRWYCNASEQGKEVLIEYGNPNLFKPLHVGNLVGVIFGESISRIFETHGATVRRLTYSSDIGLTVGKAVWGLKNIGGNPNSIEDLGRAYRAGNDAYESDQDARSTIEKVNTSLYDKSDTDLTQFMEQGKATSLRHIEELCRVLGTTFDMTIFESETAPVGLDIVRQHTPGIFEEDAGAIIFRGEERGLHTRVFVNAKGLPTYEAKDIGNFSIKRERYPNQDMSIIITGAEQREYFNVIITALSEVFRLPPEQQVMHIATGFLTLSTGKMSSRAGNVLTGESVIADLRAEAMKRAETMRAKDRETLSRHIAVAALKYWILRQRVGSDIVFDMQQAFSFEGNSGPYLQYTHARTASVLRKAEEGGIAPSTENPPETVYTCERLLHQFSEAIELAFQNRSPHHIVTYLIDIAAAFNTFYAKERIADTNDTDAPYKIALTLAVNRTLERGLWILGIPAPEEM